MNAGVLERILHKGNDCLARMPTECCLKRNLCLLPGLSCCVEDCEAVVAEVMLCDVPMDAFQSGMALASHYLHGMKENYRRGARKPAGLNR